MSLHFSISFLKNFKSVFAHSSSHHYVPAVTWMFKVGPDSCRVWHIQISIHGKGGLSNFSLQVSQSSDRLLIEAL